MSGKNKKWLVKSNDIGAVVVVKILKRWVIVDETPVSTVNGDMFWSGVQKHIGRACRAGREFSPFRLGVKRQPFLTCYSILD